MEGKDMQGALAKPTKRWMTVHAGAMPACHSRAHCSESMGTTGDGIAKTCAESRRCRRGGEKKGFDEQYAGLQSPAAGVDSAAGAGAVVA